MVKHLFTVCICGLMAMSAIAQKPNSDISAEARKKILLGEKTLTEVYLKVDGKEIKESPEKKEIEKDLCVGNTRFSFFADMRFALESNSNCKAAAKHTGLFEVSDDGLLSLYFDTESCKGCGNRMQFRFAENDTEIRLIILGGDENQTITITLK